MCFRLEWIFVMMLSSIEYDFISLWILIKSHKNCALLSLLREQQNNTILSLQRTMYKSQF